MSPFFIVLSIYGPASLFLISLICIVRLKFRGRETVFTVQPLGIFGISFPINSLLMARCILAVTAIGCLSLYALVDFSTFLPAHYQMDVFYDGAGVSRVLRENFSADELRDLGIPTEYNTYRKRYFDILDSEMRSVLGRQKFFSLTGGEVHSTGETSFIVKKIKGWQRYVIVESRGDLTHTLEAPHVPIQQFYTLFEKIPTADDYLTPSLNDLLVVRRVIVRPKFKQFLAENRTSKSLLFSVAVVGITRIAVVPWPSFSPTVYCAEFSDVGLVPIAYAIYKEM
jgi:hypothetical protein